MPLCDVCGKRIVWAARKDGSARSPGDEDHEAARRAQRVVRFKRRPLGTRYWARAWSTHRGWTAADFFWKAFYASVSRSVLGLFLVVLVGCVVGTVFARRWRWALGVFSEALVLGSIRSPRRVAARGGEGAVAGAVVLLGFGNGPAGDVAGGNGRSRDGGGDHFGDVLSPGSGSWPRWLRIERVTLTLIPAGTAICGGSAIAAIGSVVSRRRWEK